MATQVLERPVTKPTTAGTVHWLNQCVERGKVEEHAQVITITPAMASIILRRNDGNRNLRPVKVRHFARDMARGRWPLNGETIIIADTGELNDGQHRLHAVIEANIPFPATLFFGAKRSTRFTIDQGSARGAGDYLSMDGVPYAMAGAAVARMIFGFEDSDGRSLYLGKERTKIELYERVQRDAGIGEALEATAPLTKGAQLIKVPHSILAFARYAFEHEADGEDADEFLHQFATGENLRSGDPAYVLRAKLLANKFTQDQKVQLIFKAWNFHRRDMKIKANSLGIGDNLPALV